MRNLTVAVKLYFLLVSFVVSLAIVGAAGWLGIQNTSSSIDEISSSLRAVDALSTLHTARLSSIAAMQEGASWRPEIFDGFSDKSDAISEAQAVFSDILNRHVSSLEQAKAAFENYDSLPKSAEQEALWKEFSELWQDFHLANDVQTDICSKLSKAQNWNEVHTRSLELVTNTTPWSAAIQATAESLEQLMKLSVAEAAAAQQNGHSAIDTAQNLIFTVSGIAILVLGGLSTLIMRSVVRPLQHLKTSIEQVGESNDFTLRVSDKGRDEAAHTAAAFNNLLERVQHALLEVVSGAAQIDQAASQTNAMAQQVADSAELQNEAATDIASAIEQQSASVADINNNAQAAQARAEDAANAAQTGATSIDHSSQENQRVVQQVNLASAAIQNLGAESKRISSIIDVITAVAEQTNLLALNAAIEAARAGEQGRGFAVVADEVRLLAARTSTSAAEIREMVTAILSSTQQAISEMNAVVTSTENSRSLTETAAERMRDILHNAAQVSEAISGVSQAMTEQNRSTQLIAQRVENVAQMSRQNCSTGENAAVVAGQLNDAAERLRQAIRRFKV